MLTPQASQAQSHFTGHVVGVESGDRIVARLDTWNVTIQLHGITCPTKPPAAALRARQYTTRRVFGTSVNVDVRGTGSNATVYGEVRMSNGRSLNNELVQVGLATWAKRYAPSRYDIARSEADARSSLRGIWGVPDASNVPLPALAVPKGFQGVAGVQARGRKLIVLPKTLSESKETPSIRDSTPNPGTTPTRSTTVARSRVAVPHSSEVPAKPVDIRQTVADFPGRMAHLIDRAQRSIYRTPLLDAIYRTAAGAALLGFVLQLAFGGVPSARRLPFQFCTSLGVAIVGGLIAPLPYLLKSHMFTFGHGSLLSLLAPPAIAALVVSSVTLCRREQILRAAPSIALGDLAAQPTKGELIKVSGIAGNLPGSDPLISQIGNIRAVFLQEITYSYEAVQAHDSDGRRLSNGRRATRYGWTITYQEISKVDFLLSDDEGGKAVVDGGRSLFLPLRSARFYNGVPVENWFSRPYPGDTRTQIEFIGTNAPVVVWGKLSHVFSGSSEIPSARIGNDTYQNMLVVEGDEDQVWTRRPLVGLLAMLIALGLTLFVVYGLSTPGALGSQ